jgi:protein SCO1/2
MKRLTLLLIGALLLGACAPTAPTAIPTATTAPFPEGVRPLDPPVALPNFSLIDQQGRQYSLEDMLGKWTVVSFGFVNCPDVCPITLANFTLVKRALGEQADQVTFMFVSVDGARDTPEVLGKHLALFDPDFVGLTGDDNAVRPMAQAFGVRYEIVKPEGTEADYLVNHTASAFLVNPEGELQRIYSYGTDPEIIAADLRTLLP